MFLHNLQDIQYTSQITYYIPRMCRIGNPQIPVRRSAVIREAFADTLQRVRGHLTNCLWTPHEFSADTSRIVCGHLTKCPWNHQEGSAPFCGSKCHDALTPFPFKCDRTRVGYCGRSVCIMRCNVYLMRCNVCLTRCNVYLELKSPIKYVGIKELLITL